MKKKVSSIVLNLVLLVLGVVTVYPFLWMLASSFKKNSEIVALHQTFLPKLFTAGNYVSINAHFNFMRFFCKQYFYYAGYHGDRDLYQHPVRIRTQQI